VARILLKAGAPVDSPSIVRFCSLLDWKNDLKKKKLLFTGWGHPTFCSLSRRPCGHGQRIAQRRCQRSLWHEGRFFLLFLFHSRNKVHTEIILSSSRFWLHVVINNNFYHFEIIFSLHFFCTL
jgi:hypothetical protein